MPRVLIAGCGYLGAATADLLAARGWQVEGWTRSVEAADQLSSKEYPVAAVDLTDREQVVRCNGEFDAVIHCASTRGGGVDLYRRVYLEGLRNLIERFPSAKTIFTSSTSVYAQAGGEWVTEQSAAEPEHETGKILREAEQLALDRSGIVFRLAGIYGPKRSYLLQSFLAGEAVLDPDEDRFINQIHRDDAALAFALLSGGEISAGEIFNVVDDEPTRRNDCYRWLAAKLNQRPPRVATSKSKQKRGRSNKRVSNAKLRSFGWAPMYPTFAIGMERSVLPSMLPVG